MGDREIKMVCYTDDAVLIEESEEDLRRLLHQFNIIGVTTSQKSETRKRDKEKQSNSLICEKKEENFSLRSHKCTNFEKGENRLFLSGSHGFKLVHTWTHVSNISWALFHKKVPSSSLLKICTFSA